MKFFLFFIFILYGAQTFSEIIPKTYEARLRVSEIKTDGIPDYEEWREAAVAGDFTQLEPVEGAAVSQNSEVRILYDNTALYLSAILHDACPDSICHELGNRDEGGSLHSDGFKFGLDPYNTREYGYVFEVSASGVQTEYVNDDYTFDAVWESAVNVTDSGWTLEMKIPYSALRFPAASEQVWGIQFGRYIRRSREYSQWTLTPKNIHNRTLYWGTMTGLKNIDPPLRLSLTPYLSLYAERAPVVSENISGSYGNSWSYYGGADVKYGIDERFTLDMTLLPDFSQVQSDDKVKNLSSFETIYEERRPFFKEGTALFSKGDLLYTRRIGRTPMFFYDVELNEGETLEKNPDKARLINATKLSGRTDKGLGIGLLNAVTANTYAEIRRADGGKRKFLTEPATNYNLFIFDQQLKNNCNVFLVNTNVLREGGFRDANVTTLQGRFENKNHDYRITSGITQSRIRNTPEEGQQNGEMFVFYADKLKGDYKFGTTFELADKKFDRNDFGYIFIVDYTQFSAYITRHMFNPFLNVFKQGYVTFYTNRIGRLSNNNELMEYNGGMNLFLLFNSNWSIYSETGFRLRGKDYYEPRIDQRFYNEPPAQYGAWNFTTDYSKKLAFDFGGRYSFVPTGKDYQLGYYVVPMVRVSDKFNIKFSHFWDAYNNDKGFAYLDGDTSVFGERDIVTVTNTLASRYIFKNDMSLSVSARHYWSKGVYKKLFLLENSGDLTPLYHISPADQNFNSNYLTIDLVYNWQFSPGSSFIVTYKNLILSEGRDNIHGYFTNFSNTLSDPQTNSISLKMLYYIDYQYLVSKRRA